MLEVRLLGAFEVKRDGKAIAILSRPAQSLFAYLILSAGTSHRREKLAGMLWPDSLEETARENLRQAIDAPFIRAEQEELDQDVIAARKQLGKRAFEVTLGRGRAMSLQQAIEFALEETQHSQGILTLMGGQGKAVPENIVKNTRGYTRINTLGDDGYVNCSRRLAILQLPPIEGE